MFSNTLPIIEIHNTGHDLQSKTNLTHWLIRYPTSLANLVVEVEEGTRHSHQISFARSTTHTIKSFRSVWYPPPPFFPQAKKLIGLYKEIIFMNSYVKFLNIESRTPYPLTNFEDRFGLRTSVVF